MPYRQYTLMQSLFRWILGVKDPDDFDEAQNVHDGDGPIEIQIDPSDDYAPRHKIMLNPTTVKPGMGIAKGPLVYKLICLNAPPMYPQPVYNIYSGHRTGGPDELYPTDIDLLAIVIDLTKRRMQGLKQDTEREIFRQAFELISAGQVMLVAQDKSTSNDEPPPT